MRKLSLFACVILAAAVAVVGCGGDDNPTKAEFLKDGNAICKNGNKEINQAAKQIFTSKQKPSQAQLNKFANDTLIPSIQGQIDDIRDLGTPSGDEDQVNAILDDAQAALDKGKANPELLTSNNPKQDPFAKVNKEASAYGLTVCGSG